METAMSDKKEIADLKAFLYNLYCIKAYDQEQSYNNPVLDDVIRLILTQLSDYGVTDLTGCKPHNLKE